MCNFGDKFQKIILKQNVQIIDQSKLQMSEILGIGTYGKVFKSWYEQANTFVAVKEIRTELSNMSDETKVLNFLNEVKVLQHLNHKNIVKIFGITTKPLSIITEFIEGENLDDAFKKKLDLARKMELIRDLIDGVKYLHSNSSENQKVPVLHRDLKPQNLMVTKEGRLKIIDLGIAGLASNVSSLWQIQTSILKKAGGTFLYKAPENFFHGIPITLAADIWSLAIVINEVFEETIPCGYYSWAKLKQSFGFFKYPLSEQMTLLKLLLWKCLEVKFIKRPTIHEVSNEFRVFENYVKTAPELVFASEKNLNESDSIIS